MEPDDVVNALMTGRYDEIHDAGDAGFRRAVPTADIQQVWQAMTTAMGQPAGVDEGVVVHDVGLTCPNGQAHVQIAYRDGKIAGLVVKPGAPTGRFGQ